MAIPFDHLALSSSGQDPFQDLYAQKLDLAVPRFLVKLQGKIDATLFAEVTHQLELFQALPVGIRRGIVLHPYFSYWWQKFLEYFSQKKRGALEEWVREFGRFLLIPCLQQGIWAGDPLTIAINEHGELRFPGHPRHIMLAADSAQKTITLSRQGDSLVLQNESVSCQIALADLLGQSEIRDDMLIKQRTVLPGTGIEIDGNDLWVRRLFTSINSKPPLEGYPPRDLNLIESVSEETASYFTQAVRQLERFWPEFVTELYSYTRVIVPFQSQCYSTFTEFAFMGAVFMGEARQPFSKTYYTAEHLLHEHSHLRMAVIMEADPLFHVDADARFNSPFRRDPRPVNGILQGAFVFARIAHYLRRGIRITGDAALQQRLAEVLVDLRGAIKVLSENAEITYTLLGQSILEQMRVEAEMQSVLSA